MNIEQNCFCKFSTRNEWEKSWERKSLSNQWSADLLFSTATRQRLQSGLTTVRWSILIPGLPITSSRGAADTTAGRIYFSIPSAQVRIPVGDLVFPPPLLMLTLYYLGEELSGGGKIFRRRKNYPAALKLCGGGIIIPGMRGWAKILEKNPKIVAQCQKYPIPYLYALSRTIPYLYTLNRTIPYLNTLSRTIPHLNTLSRFIPYVNTLSRTIHYPNTLSRTIPYLNTLSRTIPYLNTLRKNPNLAQNQIFVGSQSESSTKKTLKPRQPIRIEYQSAEKNPNALG